jgi:aminopeptidase N
MRARLGFLFWPFIALSALLSCQSTPLQGTDGQLDVTANTVTITPNFGAKTIEVRQTIFLKTGIAGIPRITFSPNEMVVDTAIIDDEAATFTSSAAETTFSGTKPVRADQKLKLVVTYHGTPKRGVSFASDSVYTNYWACDWMFCRQDILEDESTLALNLVLPPNMTSVSIGTPRRPIRLSSGDQLHSWHLPRPFAPYLFGFAAGHFEAVTIRHRGAQLIYLNATSQPQPIKQLFATTPEMVDFYESKAGFPLPTQRYSQLLVTGSDAQEHATHSVIGTNNINPILTNPQEDWVIAHELAHQWWGNLVTCRTLQHFWLNEGIVVFMTAAWKEKRFGRLAYNQELDLARGRWNRAKEAGWDRPLAFGGEYPSLRLRRAIQYSKGALFMDHLRTLLGEDAFWQGLKSYTQTNASKSVVSRDLQVAMEHASGRDLSTTFDTWVHDAPEMQKN